MFLCTWKWPMEGLTKQMAWYKDPDTGEMIKVDLFEKPDNSLSSMKVPQSTIMVAPFNVPFRTINLEENPESTTNEIYSQNSTDSAASIAQKKAPSALMNSTLPAWVSAGTNNFISADSWFPWNMSIDQEKSDFLYNVAIDVGKQVALADELPDAGVLSMNRNITRYKITNTVDQFNKPAPPSQADPLRAYANISYLAEKSPNGTLTAGAIHAFNTYGLSAMPSFSDENSQEWKKGFYHDSTLPKEKFLAFNIVATQYKSRLTLMEETMELKSQWFGDNPFFENLKTTSDDYDPAKWTKLYFINPAVGPSPTHGVLVPTNYGAHSYRDATFEIKKPFLESAYRANTNENMGLSSPVNIQGHYNFYLLPYERAIADYPSINDMPIKVPPLSLDAVELKPIPEQLLPNMYALIHDQISDEQYFRYYDQGSWLIEKYFKYCKKENGNLYIDDPEGAIGHPFTYRYKFLTNTLSQFLSIGTKKDNINKPPVKNIANYLNAWVTTLGTINKPKEGGDNKSPAEQKYKTGLAEGSVWGQAAGVKGSGWSIAQKKYNAVGISAYKTKDFFDEASKLKKMFPFYVDIDLPMANSGQVGQILYDSGLTDIFMQNVMAAMYTISTNRSADETVPIFYNDINISMASALNETCVIRKDNQMLQGDVQPEQNTMFNETLLQLWLNDVLESDILLDLDASPANYAEDAPNQHTIQSHENYFADVPPQYYDWMHSDGSGAEYIEQIKKFKGGLLPSNIDISVLKPVVFGKAPPKAAGGAMAFLKWVSAKTKINKFINERVRSVKDIYQGKKAYSEVLFYEVVKYKAWTDADFEEAPYWPGNIGNPEQLTKEDNFSYAPISGPHPGKQNEKNKTFIQSFFIPNIPGMDMANYVDTQVKYDKGYYYQVYAHTFVVGTQYQNTALSQPQAEFAAGPIPQEWKGKANFRMDYLYKPDVHLIRVPYYNTIASANNTVALPEEKIGTLGDDVYKLASLETTLVWDRPPIFPDVSFVPLQGETGKVLINCNFNTGEYDLYPVPLDKTVVPGMKWGPFKISEFTTANRDEEVSQVKCRINQRKMTGPLTYSGDDFCGRIQILRIDKEPKSYSDFSPTSETAIATIGDGFSNFGFEDDTLKTNKNYYYVFREIDSHENYSNPSPVYMVRIVDRDGEAPYSIFKMFFMDEIKQKKANNPLKSFMKYIRIEPSLEQRSLDTDALKKHPGGSVDLVATTTLDGFVGDPKLKSAWGRTFKFRFTSKKTGKKFDLNLTLKDIVKLQKQNETSSGEPDTYKSGKC